jgi:heat shock protein HslJ
MAGACGGITEPSDTIGVQWRLMSLQEEGADPIVVEDPSRYTLRLEDNGQVAVKSDCNSCGGTYTLDGSSLELSPMTCTLIACPTGSLDPAFSRALEGTKTVTVDDDEMTITGSGVTLRFGR